MAWVILGCGGGWGSEGCAPRSASASKPRRRTGPVALPEVKVVARDGRGCGRVELVLARRSRRLRGAAPGLCVRTAFAARLEGSDGETEGDARSAKERGGPIVNVVLLVEAPQRFDPAVRTRLFVYRLRGLTLVPRFLSSGFRERDLVAVERRPSGAQLPDEPRDVLWVQTRDRLGTRELLRCYFSSFPLRCEPESADAG